MTTAALVRMTALALAERVWSVIGVLPKKTKELLADRRLSTPVGLPGACRVKHLPYPSSGHAPSAGFLIEAAHQTTARAQLVRPLPLRITSS